MPSCLHTAFRSAFSAAAIAAAGCAPAPAPVSVSAPAPAPSTAAPADDDAKAGFFTDDSPMVIVCKTPREFSGVLREGSYLAFEYNILSYVRMDGKEMTTPARPENECIVMNARAHMELLCSRIFSGGIAYRDRTPQGTGMMNKTGPDGAPTGGLQLASRFDVEGMTLRFFSLDKGHDLEFNQDKGTACLLRPLQPGGGGS